MVSAKRYGRLGNELYQAAAMIWYALKHNLEWSFPNITNDLIWNPTTFAHLHNPKWVNGKEDVVITEIWNLETQYQELEFREEWRYLQIVLNGYFQSYKFIDPYRKEILEIFNIPYEFKEKCCSLHIRRGDYLLYPLLHPVITNEYISKAINIIKEKGVDKFYVFGDDLTWDLNFINAIAYPDCEFVYVSGNSAMKDLSLMSGCANNICSNSTLSLWAAELNQNPNKIVIVPSEDNWFGYENKLTVKDLFRPEFTKIKYKPAYELW